MKNNLQIIDNLQIQFNENQKKIAQQELKIKQQYLNKEKKEKEQLKAEMLEEYGSYVEPLTKKQLKKNERLRKKYQLKMHLLEQKKLYEQVKLEEIVRNKKLDEELEEDYKEESALNNQHYLTQLQEVNDNLNKNLKQILNVRAKITYLNYLIEQKCDLNLELTRLITEESTLKDKYKDLNKLKKSKELQFLVESNFRIKKKNKKEVDEYLTLVKLQKIEQNSKENDE
uniref:Uncharacterized protein n=1 Tax=Heterostelium pallidum TaxID=13642 RepID=B2XX27_HETPA|nr:hypothetical protein [Heterostelium pallidum]